MAQTSQDLLRPVVTAVKVVAGAGALTIALSTSMASLRPTQAAALSPAPRAAAGPATATTGDAAVTTCSSEISA